MEHVARRRIYYCLCSCTVYLIREVLIDACSCLVSSERVNLFFFSLGGRARGFALAWISLSLSCDSFCFLRPCVLPACYCLSLSLPSSVVLYPFLSWLSRELLSFIYINMSIHVSISAFNILQSQGFFLQHPLMYPFFNLPRSVIFVHLLD